MIYLDHNASSPLRPAAWAAMRPWLEEEYGNPSSTHQAGQRARAAVEEARARVARLLGAHPSEIVFTSGGSSSVNLALRGCAEAQDRITTSRGEHPCVLRTAEALRAAGAALDWLDLDSDGAVQFQPPKGGLLSLMHANNETGVQYPVEEFSKEAHRRGARFHCDAAQSFGKIRVDVGELGVDLLSVAAHKFGGPKGAGFLYIRKGLRLTPLVSGGEQEQGLMAGTENVAAIVGLAAAAEEACANMEREEARLGRLRDRLEELLQAAIPGLKINGQKARRLAHTLSVIIPGARSDLMIARLDQEGIAVSAGSACAAGKVEPSHVLRAMGLPEDEARCALRFSLGWSTRPEDIETAAAATISAWRDIRNAAL